MQNNEENKTVLTVPISIVIAGVIIAGAVLFRSADSGNGTLGEAQPRRGETGEVEPHPAVIAELAIPWGELGAKLASVGVIDADKFLALYAGAEQEEARRLIETGADVVMTNSNARVVLNLLWALGLGQKSEVLSEGEMVNPRYGGAERFASTGGWTLADGSAMQHYGRHLFFKLTPEQETLVSRVAQNVYRPCCDNPAHFPDCNHGMAMLGLLELLASNGASEDELYNAALAANRLWFPDQYAVIAEYQAFMQGKEKTLTSQELVGRSLASASGFARLQAERDTWGRAPVEQKGGGGGCSV